MTHQRRHGESLSRRPRGFSLLELVVVIAITALLTAIMFPGLNTARNTAHKLMCASNLRQIGTGIILYSNDHRDRIPGSFMAEQNRPFDQMAITIPDPEGQPGHNRFVLDGLGLLIGGSNFGCYCDAAECMFCPSHANGHTFEQYERTLETTNFLLTFEEQVWANYQYVGQRSTTEGPDGTPSDTVHFLDDEDLLVTDGFRTKDDFNHVQGMNKLYGDGSISWWQDVENSFYNELPVTPLLSADEQLSCFERAWYEFQQNDRR